MTKKMIIDATHPEETRVALVDHNNRLTDFDFESTTKAAIRSNIYLAKVARVEPSLQAAFIDYGGNRHGFLAFSEIHPDYFRIPVSDRELLKEEINKLSSSQESKEEPEEDSAKDSIEKENLSSPEEDAEHFSSDASNQEEMNQENNRDDNFMPIDIIEGEASAHEDEDLIILNRPPLHKMYKIQEVIHKNQIMLVQVVKEERGLKGAALTTYLSLAGRYSVLMANSPRSGGISRKISNSSDRLRLKKILEELEIPEGMGLIVRTAGRERTKVEIKRDTDFLKRAWNDIRNLTLQSIAPCLVHEEDDIIKRAIRDLYSKDVSEVQVEGEEGYKVARLFMKNLMPSHIKRIHHYKDEHISLFYKYKVETQIDEMYNPVVHLPSGGSIVIHPTEALVSIDVNSGKSTRERHIAETAVKTNLEAADEIARQVRLRDLAGLIVIDFIDMEETRHIVSVERRLHEAFRQDRARIQMGKIGPFGLLELSRQRIRPSLLETSAHPCPHCHATGFIRSIESSSLHILRAIEEEASLGKMAEFQIHVPTNIAFYLLNTKRDHLQRLESRLNVRIFVEGDDSLISPQHRITCLKRRTSEAPREIRNPERQGTSLQHPSTSETGKAESDQEEDNLTTESDTSEIPSSSSASKRQRQRRSRRHTQRKRQEASEAISPSLASEEDTENTGMVVAEKFSISENQTFENQKTNESTNSETSHVDNKNPRRQHPFKRKRRRYPKNLKNTSSPSQQFSEVAQASESSSKEDSHNITSIRDSQLSQTPAQNKSDNDKKNTVNPKETPSQDKDLHSSESALTQKKSANTWWKRLLDN